MDTCSLFEEDEVYVHNTGKGYIFGLVLENSEFLSSSDEEDEKEEDRLQKGTVRVAWHPSGKEAVVAENKVHLVDRSLMPGDVVRRNILGQDSQCGYVANMEVKAHVRVLRSSKYIYNVDSSELLHIVPFENGQEVIMDSWWGRVDNVIIELILIFPDGAKCRVDETDLVMFDDVTEKPRDGEFSMGPHYQGQELKGPMYCLSEARWIHSTHRHSHRVANRIGKTSTVTVTVNKVEIKSIEVQWICGSEHTSPPLIVTGDDISRLRVLDWFSHCSLQIGDRMLYRVKNDDQIVTTIPAQAYKPSEAMNKEKGIVVFEASNRNNGETSVNTEEQPMAAEGGAAAEPGATAEGAVSKGEDAEEDVDLDDADLEDDSDSGDEKQQISQGGRNSVGRGSRKKPKGRAAAVRLKANKSNPKTGAKKRGPRTIDRPIKPDSVVEVEAELTTSWATVKWQDGTLEKDIPSVELFPVHHLDEHEFFPGDFVLPNIDLPKPADYGVVLKADHAERTCTVHWFKVYDSKMETRPTLVEGDCEMSVYDIKDHTHFKFRPGQSVQDVRPTGENDDAGDSSAQAVGQVYELDGNGHLVVKWADGSISQRFPQEVFIVSEEDESDNDDWDSESDYESDASTVETWETESEQDVDEHEEEESKAEREDSGYDQEAISEHRQELDSLLGRAQSALDRLQTLLNTFDVTVQAPDCFHDILRIFRSCHDLDKILKSSFFKDPELRSLVTQAKQELKREKANKFTRHLSQVFESWSQNMPNMGSKCFGLVGADGQTIKFSAGRANKAQLELSIQISQNEQGSGNDEESQGATKGGSEGEDLCSGLSQGTSMESCTFEGLGLKKEFSEPAISNCLLEQDGLSERWPSDSAVGGASCMTQVRNNQEEPNLVGENCVAKASKRVKSVDASDDSATDAKKSKEDKTCTSQVAQELCLKICRNLHKQISLIHEEINKRTAKLLHASGKGDSKGDSPAEKAPSLPEAPSAEISGDAPVATTVPTGSEAGENPEAPAAACVECPSEKVDSEVSQPCPEASLDEETSEEASDGDWAQLKVPCKGFEMQSEAPACHTYITEQSQPSNPRAFRTALRKELNLFQSSLPDGIFVKGFEDRLDLLSVMILGPEGTPYEDALFLFDLMLPNDYPSSPPVCHYHSYCSDRLNPNLYEDGKVCVSLLGTWSGKGTEVWTTKSNLLQVLVSIQGLILVPEPYYNEAGFERQRGKQVGEENSRMYNEMAILKTVQSLAKMSDRLPTMFAEEIKTYLLVHGPRMISRLRHWMETSKSGQSQPAVSAEAVSGDSGFDSSSPGPQLSAGLTPKSPDSPSDPTAQPACDKSSFNQTYDIIEVDSSGPESDSANLVNGLECHSEPVPPPHSSENEQSKSELWGSQTTTCKERIDCEPSKVSQVSSQLESLSLINSNHTLPSPKQECSISEEKSDQHAGTKVMRKPDFPLFPMSRGFCLTLQKVLKQYEAALSRLD